MAKGYTDQATINEFLTEAYTVPSWWLEEVEEEIDANLDSDLRASVGALVSETLTLDGSGENWQELDKDYIYSISSITVGSDSVNMDNIPIYNEYGYLRFKDSADIVTDTDYPFDQTVFVKGHQNIIIAGLFGRGSVPYRVKELATLLVVQKIQRISPDIVRSYNSEQIGFYRYSTGEGGAAGLPPTIKERIAELYQQLGANDSFVKAI